MLKKAPVRGAGGRGGPPLIGQNIHRVITARSHGLPPYLDLAVMRYLEIRRTGRTPAPADFDVDFPALIARTLSDLTPDARDVLRFVSLLDSFAVTLAAKTAGLTHEAAALRLVKRPNSTRRSSLTPCCRNAP